MIPGTVFWEIEFYIEKPTRIVQKEFLYYIPNIYQTGSMFDRFRFRQQAAPTHDINQLEFYRRSETRPTGFENLFGVWTYVGDMLVSDCIRPNVKGCFTTQDEAEADFARRLSAPQPYVARIQTWNP